MASEDGGTVADIAAAIFLSAGSVRNHLSAAIGKTSARTRGEVVRLAAERGWLLDPWSPTLTLRGVHERTAGIRAPGPARGADATKPASWWGPASKAVR